MTRRMTELVAQYEQEQRVRLARFYAKLGD